jgi:hypothetical protein
MTHLESFRQGLQLCFIPHSDQRSTHKVMPCKVVRVPILGISRLPLGISGQNDIWVLIPLPGTYYIIKGKGGGFP